MASVTAVQPISLESKALEHVTFKLIIPRHANSELLLMHDGRRYTLPAVKLPKWIRVIPEIAQYTSQQWGLRTISLFHPEPHDPYADHCVVLEARDSSWQTPTGFGWVSRDRLRRTFTSVEEWPWIEDILATSDAYNTGELAGAFARAGWFDELVSWAQKHLEAYGLALTGKWRQLNCGPTFSLVRLETTGPAVWFKAVGEPNLHEFPITTTLAKNFPNYVPALIATQPSWNGWLAFEADGWTLNEKSDLVAWKKAAGTLANLQIESVPEINELRRVGCRNVIIPNLLDQIEPFFALMEELMARQLKVPPAVLSREELGRLAVHAKDACARITEIGLPDTLGHLDFNMGNIVDSSEGCVFLDWAEAYVGHPFFTFEYLREHLARTHPSENTWQSEVTSCYLEQWNSVASPEQISQALKITPLIAVLAYAVSNNTWRDSHRLKDPRTAGYFRALTRRMHREARLLEARRERCLN
jgi:hypothetical protein